MDSSVGFTDAARLAIHEARLAAQDLGHGLVDTEHLLLGLIRKTPEIFQDHCQPLVLQEAVERLTRHGRTDGVEEWRELPITEGSKKALELAMRMASEGGTREVRPEHLVIALILEGEGTAATALIEVGIDSAEEWESD